MPPGRVMGQEAKGPDCPVLPHLPHPASSCNNGGETVLSPWRCAGRPGYQRGTERDRQTHINWFICLELWCRPSRVTHLHPRGGACWAGFSKLISHRRELWGPQGLLSFWTDPYDEPRTKLGACTPFISLDCVNNVEKKVLLSPSSKWGNQDRKVIITGLRSLSL